MAELTLRVNLSAAQFPLVSDWQGRTIILPRFDQNFQKSASFAGADEDRDVGIPQIFYGHNIVPTEQGIQSINYIKRANAAPAPLTPNFDALFTLRSGAENITLWSPAGGKNYIYDSPSFTWASVSPRTDVNAATAVTATFIKDAQYIYYERVGAFTYNTTTKVLDAVVLTGLTATAISGLTSSSNYLIAWDADSVYWSSLITPTDFVPSLITGAGAITPADVKGTIVACLQITGGFMIYTTANTVSATYTGNARNPWIFKEVANSGGIASLEQVTYDANFLQHFAFTTRGLQKLDKNQALNEGPQITDFLSGGTFEDWDTATNQPVQSYTGAPFKVKVAFIASRYLAVSYGVNSFTHVLLQDVSLKRWGKLKIDHVDCFNYTPPNLYGNIPYTALIASNLAYFQLYNTTYTQLLTRLETFEIPKQSIGFLQADGTIFTVDFTLNAISADSILMLGKFQFERTKMLTVLNVLAGNSSPLGATAPIEVRLLSSLLGKVFTSNLSARLLTRNGESLAAAFRTTAYNHSIVFKGTFNFNTVILNSVLAGSR